MQIEKLTDKEQLIVDFLKDNNVDELAEVVRDEWADCWSGHSYGGC